jgi:hypothetical protein
VRLSLVMIFGLGVSALLASATLAADRRPAKPDYGQDLISVVTGQQEPVPTGNCLVWANAEGLGVGPAELGGYHGLSMNINLKPIGKDGPRPTPFAEGLALLRARYPSAPAWLVKTIEANQSAIEAACAEEHDEPFTVHKITAGDRHG